jgi:hypothetical protein
MNIKQVNSHIRQLRKELNLKKFTMIQSQESCRFEIELDNGDELTVRFGTYVLLKSSDFKDIKGTILSKEYLKSH